MNQNTRRQHHEQARKRHRQELQQHARAVARHKPSAVPFWLLVVGLSCIAAFILFVTTR